MSKRFLLSASLIALLSSQAFATRQAAIDLADRESSQQAIILQLSGTHDYILDFNETQAIERIKNGVLALNGNKYGQKQDSQEVSDIEFEARHRIRNNLDGLKTSRAPIGGGYYLTKNFRGDALSVESKYSPLVYPVKSLDRDKPDGFLPQTYKSNFMSARLCQEIDDYASQNDLARI